MPSHGEYCLNTRYHLVKNFNKINKLDILASLLQKFPVGQTLHIRWVMTETFWGRLNLPFFLPEYEKLKIIF